MKIASSIELHNILKIRKGFIYNDFGTISKWDIKNNNKLHKADCYQLKQMTSTSFSWAYYFNTLEEAVQWLKHNRKEEGFVYCKTCLYHKI